MREGIQFTYRSVVHRPSAVRYPHGLRALGEAPNEQGYEVLGLRTPGFLMRLRHNPFYGYLEDRVVGWLADNTSPP